MTAIRKGRSAIRRFTAGSVAFMALAAFGLTFSGDADAARKAADPDQWNYVEGENGEVSLFMNDSEGFGAEFVCSDETLYVILSTEPMDMERFVENKSGGMGRAQRRETRFRFIGDESVKDTVTYFTRQKVIKVTGRSEVAKIFKSAVRSERLSFRVKNRGQSDIQFPERDDAFEMFVESCDKIN